MMSSARLTNGKFHPVAIHAPIADMRETRPKKTAHISTKNPCMPTAKRPANRPPSPIRCLFLCAGLARKGGK